MTMSNLKWSKDRGKKWRELSASLEAMMAPIDEPLIKRLDLPKNISKDFVVADVACGAGGTTLQIARALSLWPQSSSPQSPSSSSAVASQVMGFDISPELIEEAQLRAAAQKLKISFQVMDVGTQCPAQAPFDRVVSRFGTMFFDDPLKAFKNLHKWLAPSGQFVFAVWGPREENPWVDDINKILAKLIPITPPEPDSPGPFRYADMNRYTELLSHSGFKNINFQKWEGRLAIGGGMSPHEAARFSLSMFSVAQMLAAHTDEVRTQAFEMLSDYYASSLKEDEVVKASASVWLVSGQA